MDIAVATLKKADVLFTTRMRPALVSSSGVADLRDNVLPGKRIHLASMEHRAGSGARIIDIQPKAQNYLTWQTPLWHTNLVQNNVFLAATYDLLTVRLRVRPKPVGINSNHLVYFEEAEEQALAPNVRPLTKA